MSRPARATLVAIAVFGLWLGIFLRSAGATENSRNVILLVLDGVRYQEMFYGIDHSLYGLPASTPSDRKEVFFHLWQTFAKQGVVLGEPYSGVQTTNDNWVNLSSPAYHNIFAGSPQPCFHNGCSQIGTETFAERLIIQQGLRRAQVATITSWKPIKTAVEHRVGSTYVNAGIAPLPPILEIGQSAEQTAALIALNRKQREDTPPWSNARWDKYTFAYAMRYLKSVRPRFLFIGLNDADAWGHRDNYPRYIQTLKQFDLWIREIFFTLQSLGEYGKNTTLIVTTDHGRREGTGWSWHGPFSPSSAQIWMFAKGPRTFAQGVARMPAPGKKYTHSSIRPTIEMLLGLAPQVCEDCGELISEIVSY